MEIRVWSWYMTHRFGRVLSCAAVLALLPVSGAANTVPAQCNAMFTACGIPENVMLQLPFLAVSGDVILLDPTVSDVFRIFNNFVDTGGGTGLGNLAFLYSSDDTTPLPNPATYSANALMINEDPSGVTHYFGNGTDYALAIPEPSTFGFLVLGLVMMAMLSRNRQIS
jgi:hypothetical protein